MHQAPTKEKIQRTKPRKGQDPGKQGRREKAKPWERTDKRQAWA